LFLPIRTIREIRGSAISGPQDRSGWNSKKGSAGAVFNA
jgi:hypothetical protein